jgi:hypothetical protein
MEQGIAMLSNNLKADVLEIVAIATECPESLRDKCFELLLSHYLKQLEPENEQGIAQKSGTAAEDEKEDKDDTQSGPSSRPSVTPASEHDLAIRDVHVKAQRFLAKYGKTIEDLNQIFYKEAGELRPLYEDLKTTKTAESQTRIALLHALLSGINTGEFQFDGEQVRKECQTRKCYDANNFSANFKNNSGLFDGFEKYEKQSPTIRLSEAGRESLAKVITELR